MYKGIYWPSLTNSFNDGNLELAYLRYSHRQRQKSLIIVNIVDLLLKVSMKVSILSIVAIKHYKMYYFYFIPSFYSRLLKNLLNINAFEFRYKFYSGYFTTTFLINISFSDNYISNLVTRNKI